MTAVSEVEQLLSGLLKADMIESFDEAIFSRYVESIIVYSQEEIGFKLEDAWAYFKGKVGEIDGAYTLRLYHQKWNSGHR